jgi:orotidine-5'-phosphate decarboxylase
VRALKERGRRTFLDLKLHDIPNTVKGAAAEAARLGADLLTVHAAGGEAMVRAAVEGIRGARGATEVVAVTLLTSLDPLALPPGFTKPFDLHHVQAQWLAMSLKAGAKGIVCSASDLPGIRKHHPEPFFAVTPGIRPAGVGADDQKRIATVFEAVRLGAGMLVLGRAVTAAVNPSAALETVRREARSAAGPAKHSDTHGASPSAG